MSELAARARKHFTFSAKETQQLLVTALVIAFSLTLWQGWGFFDLIEGDDLFAYIINLVLILALGAITLMIHVAAQKIIALQLGYECEYRFWPTGLLIGMLITFVTGGWIPLFFPGSTYLRAVPKLRMGVFRGGVMHRDLGIVSAAGPVANVVVVGLLALLYMWSLEPIFFAFIALNLFTALFSLLPVPTFSMKGLNGATAGLNVFIASRLTLIFLLSTVFVFTLLIMIVHIFSYLLAIAIGVLLTFLYYHTFETAKR